MRRLQIAVIGTAGPDEYPNKKPDKKAYAIAYELGKLIAENDYIVVCGGMGGIMEEVCRGAKENMGITVGVVAGNQRLQSNIFIDVEVVSGIINGAEENLIISMSDGAIAIGGGAGTLQELAIAYRNNKPVIAITGVGGWSEKIADTFLDERNSQIIKSSATAKQALSLLLAQINNNNL